MYATEAKELLVESLQEGTTVESLMEFALERAEKCDSVADHCADAKGDYKAAAKWRSRARNLRATRQKVRSERS